MQQKINLNAPPYNDDYSSEKNYYKVLFRPGYSVQSRELTGLQSILQNQIENIGRSQFKQGQQVVPGEVAFNNKLNYVKLASVSEVAVNINGNIVFQKYDIAQLAAQKATIRGQTSGVTANVISFAYSSPTESDVIFVKYTSSGNSSDESIFRQGEILEAIDIVDTPTLVVGTDGSVFPTSIEVKNSSTGIVTNIDSPAMGFASAVKVESGVYFVNGYFVNNSEELIVIDKYYNKPSVKVGFEIAQSIETPETDSTLYDNAVGYSNLSAPGAHRLKIQLNLIKNNYNDIINSNYIELVTIKDGEILKLIKQSEYNTIEETLARRTYDESGDYVVENFPLDLREYYQNNNNKGLYPLNVETNLVNDKFSEIKAKSLMGLTLGGGKSYVKGYEIIKKNPTELTVNKARDTITREDVRVKSNSLSYFNITNVYGSIPLNADGQELTAYPTLFLNSAFNDGSIGNNNTELDTEAKQTLTRRNKKFTINDGIVTLYLENPGNFASRTFPSPSTFGGSFNKIWYIVSLGTSPATTIVRSAEVLSYSVVKKPYDVSVGSPNSDFLELTVVANKEDIQNFLKEYDDQDLAKRRKLFISENDAKEFYFQVGTTTVFPYSHIVDYNELITPIIGVSKPKDFSLIERGTGFNTDTDIILSKGRLNNGNPTYNSVFKLSHFNPVFFTQLTLDDTIASFTFIPGKYILGSTSGAYGVIEGSSTSKYTSGNILFIKTLSGQFVSGETITDESGNSMKIATDGTISHFIVTSRGAGYPITTKLKVNGISYTSSAIEIGLTATTIYKINIRDRNLFSQIYASTPSISFDTQNTNPAQESIVIPVLFRNSVYTYNQENVKSIHSTFGAGNAYTFTADIESFRTAYINSKITTNFTFFGLKGNKFIECNGFSGDPSNDLVKGDLIQFTNSDNSLVRVTVQRVDKSEGLLRSKVYIDNVLQSNVTNASVVRVRPIITNTAKSSLIIPTGSNYVGQIKVNGDNSKISYFFRRDFVTTASTSGGTVTFAAQLPYGTQRFAAFTENNFLLTVLDKKSSTTLESGDLIYLKPEQVEITNSVSSSSGLTAGSVSIKLPNLFFGTSTAFPILKLTCTLEVTKSSPRLKTIYRNQRILIVSPGDRIVPIRGTNFDNNSTDILSYSDVIKVRYIYEGTTQTPPVVSASGELVTGTDVTERFTFDDGQRDTFYDVSKLVLKPGFDPPSGQLIIAFDYFEHSQGDFCTVDSYLHESGVELNEIPVFNSVAYGKISLRDVFDFRPKVDSSAIISGYQDTALLSISDYSNFTGSAGISSSTPATESDLEYTIAFTSTQFLDRIDGVYISKKGEFFVKEGNSSLNPTKPNDVDDSLALYYLYVPAYTSTSDDVKIIPVDNKRYTMRDISKLERRIDRLEQYTLLSVLEQQALNMQIKDEIGLDRFKSGFVVDGFENHSLGHLTSIDYKCSIDTIQSVLRPRSIESCHKLEETNIRKDQRDLDGYQKFGDVITLPVLNNIPIVQNLFATKTIKINPFVVDQYVGECRLYPNIDQWFNDTETPLILDNDSKIFSVFYANPDAREGFSSLHNNFIINWVGSNRVFYNVTSLNDVSFLSATSTTKIASVSSSSNISPENNQLAQGILKKSIGQNTVGNSIQLFCRSVPVFFNLTRMKPGTKFYVFMDGKSIDRWIVQDYNYTGIGGNSLSQFNSGIKTDINGNASGMILIPSGYAPESGSTWQGDINTVSYDTQSNPLLFTTGNKVIKFTSSSVGEITSEVDSFTETIFYATGILPTQPSSIVSTSPAIFKAQEGIQFVETIKTETKPNPLSQSFTIENYEGGVFVTGMDLYFNQKNSSIPVKVYLTNIETGKPGKQILPGSECVVNPDTYLKIYTNGTLNIASNELITGVETGCAGPIKEIYDRNRILLSASSNGTYTLTNDQVYTLVLSNHNGRKFNQTEELTSKTLQQFNASNNPSNPFKIFIAKDSGRITALKINNSGSGYEESFITLGSPQLLGGVQSTAVCSVSNGFIYSTDLIVSGSGYTEAPSVIISKSGISAANASIEAILTIDTPAVRMGVAVDSNAKVAEVPTRFDFEYPIYLQNNTEYAFAIESDSIEYVIWASRLGELEQTTNSPNTVVTSQPLLGSVYKSQNIDTWQEDLFEDIKFTLYRAEFDTSRNAILELSNAPLGFEILNSNPFETDSISDTTSTSLLYKNNNKIIKVNHRNHGFESNNKSFVHFKNCVDVGGITSELLNQNLFSILDCGNSFYTINTGVRASSNSVGGGAKVLASCNKKYEKLFCHVQYLNFNETKINAEIKTTNIIPVDSATVNYSSYSQSLINDGYEKTFLNEEHYFNNQKVLASRINELKNMPSSDTAKKSLSYRLTLSSTKNYLSPVVDLRSASVKLITNLVDKPSGKEDRFGRRDQIIKFYPIYKFNITGPDSNTISIGDAANPKIVTGNTSQARAIIVRLDTTTSELYVKMLTDTLFTPSESLVFASQLGLNTLTVGPSGLTEIPFNFIFGTTITALDKTDLTKQYSNIISGDVVLWDAQKKELIISNNKNPINDNYTAYSTSGSSYARIPFLSSARQQTDIFRVNDFFTYENQVANTKSFLEIKSVSYTNGILYVDNAFNNSSVDAKYVTKEIAVENDSTNLDVRLTANVFQEDDIIVLYKTKSSGSQFNFDDIGWQYFNGTGGPDVRVSPTIDNSIAPYIENQNSYKEYKYSISNLNEFTSYAIKIILRSSQPVFPPKIQDLRIVASI